LSIRRIHARARAHIEREREREGESCAGDMGVRPKRCLCIGLLVEGLKKDGKTLGTSSQTPALFILYSQRRILLHFTSARFKVDAPRHYLSTR